MFNALFIDNSPLNPPAKIASPCDGNEVATRSWRAMLSRAVDQVSEFPSKISTTCETPCSANGEDVSVCMCRRQYYVKHPNFNYTTRPLQLERTAKTTRE